METYELINQSLVEFWTLTCRMAPYLLFGFLLAGILSAFISTKLVVRHLGDRGLASIFKAAFLGIPLPICSCGVLPVTASLHDRGASKGATLSFLTSTPQSGVDSVLVTYSLLGPVFAIFRPFAALVSGVITGFVVETIDRRVDDEETTHEDAESHGLPRQSCCESDAAESAMEDEGGKSIVDVFRYGFGTLFGDVAGSLLIGLVVATAITVIIPDNWFEGVLGSGVLSMVAAMAFGVPLYVCSTASVPMALAMITKGLSPGAALVFLMTGTATNAVSVATIWKLFGKRTTILYLVTICVTAALAGMALNLLYAHASGAEAELHQNEGLSVFSQLAGAGLLLLAAGHLVVGFKRRFNHGADGKERFPEGAVRYSVEGMTCEHCAKTVAEELERLAFVERAEVDLQSGSATVVGKRDATVSDEKIIDKIQKLGYQAKRIRSS